MFYQLNNKLKKITIYLLVFLMIFGNIGNVGINKSIYANNDTPVATEEQKAEAKRIADDILSKVSPYINSASSGDLTNFNTGDNNLRTKLEFILKTPTGSEVSSRLLLEEFNRNGISTLIKSVVEKSSSRSSWEKLYNDYIQQSGNSDGIELLGSVFADGILNIKAGLDSNVSTDNTPPIEAGNMSDGSLTAPHTMSDIYASYIFSTASTIFAGSKEFTYNDLAKYPPSKTKSSDGASIKNIAYGRMPYPRPSESISGKVGTQMASYMKTLYDYNWLQVGQVNSGLNWGTLFQSIGGFFSGIWNFLTSFFINLFEYLDLFLDPILDVVKSVFANLNVVNLFSPLVNAEQEEGLSINGLITSLFENAGLTPRVLGILQMLFMLIIFTIVMILAFAVVREGKRKTQRVSKIKTYFIKALTIVLVIPLGLMLKDLMDGVANSLESGMDDQRSELVDSYVVDTLKWATLLNLSLDPVTGGGGFNNSSVNVSESANPTVENIKRLNDAINQVNVGVDYIGSESKLTTGSIENGKLKREPIMDKVSSSSYLSIDSYFSRLSSISANTTALGLTSKAVGFTDSGSIGVGYEIDGFKPYDRILNNPIMLFGKTGDNTPGGELGLDTLTEDSTNRKGFFASLWEGIKGFFGADSLPEEEIQNRVIQTITLESGDHSQSIHIPDSAKMNFARYQWNVGASYLYGAVSSRSVNATYGAFANYISDPTIGPIFAQNLNPITMDLVHSFEADEEPDDGDANVELQRLLDTNALTLALRNRYTGAFNSNTPTNQSVAFLLQTRPFSGGLVYQGKNIPTSLQSGTMNHGTDYNGFKQYVIPHSSAGDYGTKFFTLSITVVISAMISAVSVWVLLTGSILGSIYKIFSNFFKAFFMGNTASLFMYAVYYLALRLTMIFIDIARISIISIVNFIQNILPGMGYLQQVSYIPVIGQLFVIFIALGVGWLVTKPLLSIPGPNGMREVSIVRAFMEIPLTLAYISDGKIRNLFDKAFGIKGGAGKDKSPVQLSKYAKDELEHRKEAAKGVGGVSKDLLKAGAMALGAGVLANQIGKKKTDTKDENAELPEGEAPNEIGQTSDNENDLALSGEQNLGVDNDINYDGEKDGNLESQEENLLDEEGQNEENQDENLLDEESQNEESQEENLLDEEGQDEEGQDEENLLDEEGQETEQEDVLSDTQSDLEKDNSTIDSNVIRDGRFSNKTRRNLAKTGAKTISALAMADIIRKKRDRDNELERIRKEDPQLYDRIQNAKSRLERNKLIDDEIAKRRKLEDANKEVVDKEPINEESIVSDNEKTLEEIKETNPTLYNEIQNADTKDEKDRLIALGINSNKKPNKEKSIDSTKVGDSPTKETTSKVVEETTVIEDEKKDKSKPNVVEVELDDTEDSEYVADGKHDVKVEKERAKEAKRLERVEKINKVKLESQIDADLSRQDLKQNLRKLFSTKEGYEKRGGDKEIQTKEITDERYDKDYAEILANSYNQRINQLSSLSDGEREQRLNVLKAKLKENSNSQKELKAKSFENKKSLDNEKARVEELGRKLAEISNNQSMGGLDENTLAELTNREKELKAEYDARTKRIMELANNDKEIEDKLKNTPLINAQLLNDISTLSNNAKPLSRKAIQKSIVTSEKLMDNYNKKFNKLDDNIKRANKLGNYELERKLKNEKEKIEAKMKKSLSGDLRVRSGLRSVDEIIEDAKAKRDVISKSETFTLTKNRKGRNERLTNKQKADKERNILFETLTNQNDIKDTRRNNLRDSQRNNDEESKPNFRNENEE